MHYNTKTYTTGFPTVVQWVKKLTAAAWFRAVAQIQSLAKRKNYVLLTEKFQNDEIIIFIFSKIHNFPDTKQDVQEN